MKNLFLLLSLFVGISVSAQEAKRDIIPIEQLQKAADQFAGQRWGNVDPADPIPYYDPQGNIIAYGFNYAIDRKFPKEGRPTYQDENELDNENISKNQRWGVNEYAHCIFGNNLNRTSLVRFIAAMSDEYAFYDEIREMAVGSFKGKSKPVLDKIYFQSPMLKYYKFDSGNESVYVRIFPPARVLSPAEFQNEYVKNFDINKVLPLSIKENWNYFLNENQTKNVQAATYIPYQEECVPFLDWHFGCSPTAGGMLLDYWDNYSDYSSNNYGNLTKYHFYEAGNGGPDYNITSSQEACAIHMGTIYSTGSTDPNNIGPGVVAAANSSLCGSYNFTQSTTFYSFGVSTAKWNQQIGEINANRPWHCGVDNHSMTAIGYEVIGSDNFMIVHNTWDPPNDWWNYTLNYRISEIYPSGSYGSHIKLLTPQGDPAYNHNGDGEVLYSGNVYEITWSYDSYSGAYCKLLYSTNAGISWNNISTSTPCDGSYLWTVPSGLSSTQGRVKIEMYSSGGTLIASDGSWGNFKFFTGGSIVTLSNDVAVNTTTDPTFYQIHNTNSKWGAVGVRSTDNWSIKMYTDNTFANEAEISAFSTETDFILFDQHHLSNTTRGVQCYQFSGTASALTEYEGGTETLSVGVPQYHSWTANDVVEVWDIYLGPGTYKFTMNYNSGSANLDMALFSSYGGGPYYKNRLDYLARSTNNGTANETFFVTIPGYDYYGFIVWSNDANSASVTITAETTTAGLWEGDVSTNWNTAGNWNDNTVPSSTTDVVIPSGTTHSPYVSSADAYAKNVTIESGATLHIGEYDLEVDEDVVVNGTIRMYNNNADLYCDDIIWESGSQANMEANGEFRVYGDWNFENGANVQLDSGNVVFSGSTIAYIRSYEADCYFNKVYAAKTGGAYIGVSHLSGEDLVINGDLYIYSYSAFNIFSSAKVIFNGSFNNVGGHFLANYGTVEFAGDPTITLKPNVGDYFNNLRINVGTGNSLGLGNSYSDSLVVKGDVYIETGNFDSNDLTITVGDDWTNQSGTYGFYEQTGKVIFNGSSGYQYCYGETFYDLQHNSGGSTLLFYGLTNITNNYYCYGNAYAYHDMNIDNMFLGIGSSFNAYYSGVEVDIDDLDMGTSILGLYLFGTIEAHNGSIYVGDLAEDGLYGTFKVSGSNGLLDITQDASGYVDLNGSIEISNGTMNIHGGATTSYWPYNANASVTMSGGVLDIVDVGVRINPSTYTLTTNITGGTIRMQHTFTVADTWNPSAGTVEFYGTAYPNLNMSNASSALYNLHVNKTSGELNCNSSTGRVSHDVIIDGGVLRLSCDTFYVGGDWTNNIGTLALYEMDNTVCFYGPSTSNIYTDEDFDELVIDKSYAGYNGVVLASGKTLHCYEGSLHVVDGTFEMDANSITEIDNDLIIEDGAGFNNNDSGTEVFLGGDLTDYNTTISSTSGLSVMSASNDWTFNGSGDQALNVSSTAVEFGNLIVDKTYQSNLNVYDGFRVNGDLTVTSGDWIDVGAGQNYYLAGDMTVEANGAWFAYDATVHFEGSSTQYLEEVGYSGYFGNVVVNSSSLSGGVNLNSDLIILGNHDLTINSGHLWADGNLVRVIGNMIINSSGELNMDDDSELNIGNSGYLDINSGGVFEAIGSEGHEVVIKGDNMTYWQFNCLNGGTVSAEWASFTDLDYWGVYIFNGGIVNTSHSFNHCTFLPGEPGGSLLWIDNAQNLTVNYANFPNQGSSTYNVSKLTATGQVTMMNYMGNFAGEANDYDPNNNVIWTSDLIVVGTITNVSCNGGNDGAVDVSVGGGTPGYTFLWSDGATQGDRTNLTAGTYTLTTTDTYGLQVTNTFTVSEPTLMSQSFTKTNVSCNGGSDGTISLSVSGGTSPYSYNWSNGATGSYLDNLSSGIYLVTVSDANGCATTGTQTVTQPTVINYSATITDCSAYGSSDGAVNLAVAGGTWPYAYSWSNGATVQDISGLVAGTYTVTITDGNGCVEIGSYTVQDGVPPGLFASGVVFDVDCNGNANGSINLSVSGGVSPYAYSWSNGATTQDISGLSAGNYAVTVTDAASQTATASFTVSEPNALTLTPTIIDFTCYGSSDGNIHITIQGGTPSYSILWSTGNTLTYLFPLAAGTYTVTVTDANGCAITGSYTLNMPDQIQISGTVTDVTLVGGADGSIAASASDGVAPYTYAWSNGATTATITGLSAGTYWLTVTDANGCYEVESFVVNDGTPPPLSLYGLYTNVSCNGVSDAEIDITVIGGTSPYSYLWNDGATVDDRTGLSAGNYTVTVTDALALTASQSFTITEPAMLTMTSTTTDVTCYGYNDGEVSVIPSGGTSPYSYLWNTAYTGQNLIGVAAGTYTVTVTDANGCAVTGSYTLNMPAQIQISGTVSDVTLVGGSDGSIAATATDGVTPYTYLWSNGATTATITGLSAGTYWLTVTDANGCYEGESFVVNDGSPPPLYLYGLYTNVSCNGGSDAEIDLTVTGGTSPYSYLWSDGATVDDRTGLSAGTYTVTVTDALTLTASQSFTITEPAMLTMTSTTTNATCYGYSDGEANVFPSGGSSPYSYSWNTGYTGQYLIGVAAGTYTVTVTDANGCLTTGSFTVSEPSEITAAFVVTDESGPGNTDGALDVTVSGGTPAYTYLWSTGAVSEDITGLSAGTYTVSVSDASSCSAVFSETVGVGAMLGPGWSYTNTGSNHSILISDTADLTINGVPIAVGDYLGVFFDSLGTLACGGYLQWQGNTAVLTAWGEDLGNDGFAVGEAFTWKVWDASADIEYMATVSYIPPPLMPNQGYFAVNGMSGLSSLSTTETQLISIPLGWSIISTYIDPSYDQVDSVFSPVISDITIVKNGSGLVYWPAFGVNAIGAMVLGEGYQVKASSAVILPVTGVAVTPELTPVTIPGGWSIIAYLRQVPGDVETMMSPIVANVIILKNGAGQVYWPAFGVNAIGNMVPGEGYQIKLTVSSTLTYPANSVVSKSTSEVMLPGYFMQATPTDNNMTLGIPTSAFEELPMIGNEVAVFDHNDLLVGSAVFNGGNLAITVWGDDEITSEIEGLSTAQDFILRIWNGQSEQEMLVDSWTQGDGLYERDAIQIAEKVSIISMNNQAYSLEQNVPNPFRQSTRISFYLPETSDINITIYDVLGNVMEVVAKGEYQAGKYTIEVDGSKYAMGTYFYQLVTNKYVNTKQMEISR